MRILNVSDPVNPPRPQGGRSDSLSVDSGAVLALPAWAPDRGDHCGNFGHGLPRQVPIYPRQSRGQTVRGVLYSLPGLLLSMSVFYLCLNSLGNKGIARSAGLSEGLVASADALPRKPWQGDRIAVVSPSRRSPGGVPHPVRSWSEPPPRRVRPGPGGVSDPPEDGRDAAGEAADITAAFADPSIKAVIAAIGGEDQITVIPHLDDEVIKENPKPFFGYSDNTNLLAHRVAAGCRGAITGFGDGAIRPWRCRHIRSPRRCLAVPRALPPVRSELGESPEIRGCRADLKEDPGIR